MRKGHQDDIGCSQLHPDGLVHTGNLTLSGHYASIAAEMSLPTLYDTPAAIDARRTDRVHYHLVHAVTNTACYMHKGAEHVYITHAHAQWRL